MRRERPPPSRNEHSKEGKDKHPGDDLFSPRVAPPVSLALRRFTAVCKFTKMFISGFIVCESRFGLTIKGA